MKWYERKRKRYVEVRPGIVCDLCGQKFVGSVGIEVLLIHVQGLCKL